MTEQNGETWRKGPSRQPTSDGDYVYLTVPHSKSGVQSVQMPEWLADVIIADHELAAQREALLTRVSTFEVVLTPFTTGVQGTPVQGFAHLPVSHFNERFPSERGPHLWPAIFDLVD